MFKRFLLQLTIAFFSVVALMILSIVIGHVLLKDPDLSASTHSLLAQIRMPLTVVRIMMYIGFYCLWPKIIMRRAIKHAWPKDNIQKAVRLRYPLLLFLLFLEIMNQLNHAI